MGFLSMLSRGGPVQPKEEQQGLSKPGYFLLSRERRRRIPNSGGWEIEVREPIANEEQNFGGGVEDHFWKERKNVGELGPYM